jgi:hypothetical protein
VEPSHEAIAAGESCKTQILANDSSYSSDTPSNTAPTSEQKTAALADGGLNSKNQQ